MTNLLKKIIGNDNKHLTYQLEQHLGKVSVAPARAKAETANSRGKQCNGRRAAAKPNTERDDRYFHTERDQAHTDKARYLSKEVPASVAARAENEQLVYDKGKCNSRHPRAYRPKLKEALSRNNAAEQTLNHKADDRRQSTAYNVYYQLAQCAALLAVMRDIGTLPRLNALFSAYRPYIVFALSSRPYSVRYAESYLLRSFVTSVCFLFQT